MKKQVCNKSLSFTLLAVAVDVYGAIIGCFLFNSSQFPFFYSLQMLLLCLFISIGGNIIKNGSYIIHTFLGNGYFYLSDPMNAEILVIGGGGAGGGRDVTGGGGAGGLIYVSSRKIDAGNYSVKIGLGGTGIADSTGKNGGNSVFLDYTAIGGGAGPRYDGTAKSGGSGGGGGREGTKLGASGTSGQGYSGGNGYYTGSSSNGVGGGGGGAGESGKSTTDLHNAGNGGNGRFFEQFMHAGSPPGWFAGGGGGSPHRLDSSGVVGTGGLGGGAAGGVTSSQYGRFGVANTGGGGGASRWDGNGIGGSGGSGIVIIRYMIPHTSSLKVGHFAPYLFILLNLIIL